MNLTDVCSQIPAASRMHDHRIPFKELAIDGYVLGGFTWRHLRTDLERPLVITYGYRGIGESRSGSLRGFKASWSGWGVLDFEAMLQRATTGLLRRQ